MTFHRQLQKFARHLRPFNPSWILNEANKRNVHEKDCHRKSLCQYLTCTSYGFPEKFSAAIFNDCSAVNEIITEIAYKICVSFIRTSMRNQNVIQLELPIPVICKEAQLYKSKSCIPTQHKMDEWENNMILESQQPLDINVFVSLAVDLPIKYQTRFQ